MSEINNKRSYTEYTITKPTTNFAIGFDDFDEGGKDNILVTLNGVLVESLGYAAIRKNESTVSITPAITEGTVRLTRETDIDEPFHKFTAGALFSAKSMDENFQQVRHSQQEVRDGFVFLEYNTNGIVQASKEATAQAKVATVEATASAVRAETAADTAVQAVGSLQGVVNAATTATTKANTATATATTAASQATAATTSAQNAALAANTAKQEAAAATANAKAATADTLAATGRANEAAERVENTDVSQLQQQLDALPFEGGVLADTFVTGTSKGTGGVSRNQRGINSDITSVLDFYDTNLPTYNTAFNNAINYLAAKGGGTVHIPDGVYPVDPVVGVTLKSNVELRGSTNVVFEAVAHKATNYEIIRAHGIDNWKVSGIRVNGRKDLNTSTSGEWGMGISVCSSTNGSIEDFIAENCWGDGVYFGRLGAATDPSPDNGGIIPYSQNVNMRNVRCSKNRRQGISVISLKDSTWDNIICSDTEGTAPQDGVDFEPDAIDDVISNITINGLVTSGNKGYGVQFYLLPWRGLSPVFTEADLSAAQKLLTPAKQAILVSKYISSAKDTNKLSVTINNWVHNKGAAFAYLGTHSKYLQGFIEINNSNLDNSNGKAIIYVGCNHAEGVQLYLNKTKLIQNKVGSEPHVAIDQGLFDEPMGGVHFQNVDFLLSGSATVPASYPILVTDNSGKTTKFANVSSVDCRGWGASRFSRIALSCRYHIDNLRLVDGYGAWRMVTYGSAPTINNNYRVSEYIKQDVAGYMAMNITTLPTDIDTYITNSESPVNPAMLILLIGGAGLLDMPFKNGETTVRLIIPTNYWIKLRGMPNGQIRVVDSSSTLLDMSKNYNVTRATVASKSWAVGAKERVTVTHPYVALGDTVIANASTGTAGLTLNAQVTAAKTVEVTITNNTSEVITWGGTVGARVL